MNRQSPPRRLRAMRRRSRRWTFWSLASALVVTTSFLSASVSPASNLPGQNGKVLFADNVVVYSNDFSSSIGSEWSANAGILTTPSSERVLGSTTQFGSPDLVVNETLALTLTGLPAHSLLDLSVDLYTVKSWDGNRTDFGPDSWDLNVTGTSSDVQPLSTFSNFVGVNQAYPDAYPGGSHPGMTGAAANGDLLGLGSSGNGEIPAARYGFNHSFAHTANSVTFNFTGSNLQHAFDEGWVLDNVVVSVTDLPPVASFTASPNPAACGQAITFDASGSTHQDPDRSIVSYDWAFGDAATGSGQIVTHAYAAFGSYTATLTVTDDGVPSRTDTVTENISVNQGNTTPVARPGGPYNVPLGEGISLNGSASTDPDAACGDSIVAYEWDISNDGDIDKNGPTPTVSAQEVETLGAGTHPVSLRVKDEFNTTGTASTTLTVFVNEPVASFTAVPSEAGCAEAIMFDGSSSYHPNPNRSIVSYDWDFGDGNTGSGVTTTHTYFGQGTFTATLTVTDDNVPPRTDTATVTVTVSWPNHEPGVSPGGPYTVPLGEGITLDGSGSYDTDAACGDSIVAYEWDIGYDGVFNVDHTGRTLTLTAQEVETLGAGTHLVALRVRDEFGAQSTATTTLTVFVNEPVASATATPSTAGCAEAITFDGSGSYHPNPDRSIVSYGWDFGDGTTGSGVTVTHTYFGSGTFTATLTVTDDNTPPRTDTATVTVTVTWPNEAPVARPGGPYTVPLGEGITLDGSGSFDSNAACGDQIAAYEWDIGYGGVFTVDHTGPTPTLTSQEVETLGAGTHQVALRVRDEFGTQNLATTTLTVFDSPSTISGDLSCNSVNGNGFAANSSVSVVLKDLPGGATVYNNPSVPTDPNGNFNLFCGFGPDLVPGMEITASDGSATKVLVLADLTIDVVDPATDVVSGTAPANSSLFVGVNNPPAPSGAGQNTTADGTGNWSVDFTGTFDITGGTSANASVADADGDRTHINKPPATISGDLSCNSVNGNGFASNSSVGVVVKDASGGATVYDNPSVPTDPNGNFNLFCGFGPDLTPGMEITVSGGPDTKVLVLADLTIDVVDPATDVVSGTAPSGAEVNVGVNNPLGPGGANRTVTADGTGAWTADFTGTFDITGGTHANASVPDGDGDRTNVNKPPATISGDISCNSVNGNGFAANSSVSVVLKDLPGGATVYNNPSVPTDPNGNFNLFCGFGPDLVSGMEITVSDGPETKVLVLADLTIVVVDPATDVVAGTAPANSSLFVGVNNPPAPSGAGQNTTADGTGNWSVDFTGTFDITGGTHANASMQDADGDSTHINKPPATISGDLSCNSVFGNGFAPNSSASVVVKDGPGGATVYSNPSVPTGGNGSFNLFCGFGPDLVPGMEITASDSQASKVLVLADLTIDQVDPGTDTVSGTAPSGAEVNVGVNNPPSGGGANLMVTADGTGAWTADFTGIFDVTGGTHANASVQDADGDSTHINKPPATIDGDITDDGIGGGGFAQSSTVTVEVRSTPGGSLLLSATTPTDGDGNFGLCCGPDAELPDLVPGMEITVSDGSATKVLVLADLTIDVVDPAADVVSGTAPANSPLFVGVAVPLGPAGAGLNTTADGSGNWSVDFTGTFDIDALTHTDVHVFDDDGDTTSAQERPPTIHGNYCCFGGNINGDSFTAHSSVTVEIFDSPGGSLLVSDSIATDRFGNFGFDLESTGVSLAPGMYVVATDDTTLDAKELTLVALTFDALNFTNDTASGTASPGTTVLVGVFDGPSLEVVTNGSGDWSADFGAQGFDITFAMGAIAQVLDSDGDSTDDEVFPPTISANLIQNHVNGSDFTPNSSVSVEVFASPGGTLLFSGSAETGEFGEFGVSRDATGVDLVPGMQVTATDDTTSGIKELTLVPITFDVLNPITDTASGTAPPNATVFLEIFDSGGEFSRQLIADGSGAWSIDLGAAGFDVINGGGNVSVRDADDDSTEADRGVPAFSAILNTDDIGGYNFTNSSTVSVRIFDSPGGTLLFSGSATVGPESTFTVGFNAHGVDLVAGMRITVTDDTTSIAKELTLVSVTFDVLDPVNDVASGTAPPGMLLGLEVGEGKGETAPADQNGDWVANDFGPPPAITPDMRGEICAVDSDGDCTGAEYVPEADLLLTKTDPMGRQPTGRNMTYTLTVANGGPRAAYEVVATDQLPSSVTFVSATPTQGNCAQSGGTVTCTLGTIGSGATVTIDIVVKPTVAGTIINTASVTASTPDPTGGNNTDSESTSICRITSRRSSIPCG